MTTEHTPLPLVAHDLNGAGFIDDGDGLMIVSRISPALAHTIVRAVNAHDDLVAALEAIADATVRTDGVFAQMAIDRFRVIARAALAKVEGAK